MSVWLPNVNQALVHPDKLTYLLTTERRVSSPRMGSPLVIRKVWRMLCELTLRGTVQRHDDNDPRHEVRRDLFDAIAGWA